MLQLPVLYISHHGLIATRYQRNGVSFSFILPTYAEIFSTHAPHRSATQYRRVLQLLDLQCYVRCRLQEGKSMQRCVCSPRNVSI